MGQTASTLKTLQLPILQIEQLPPCILVVAVGFFLSPLGTESSCRGLVHLKRKHQWDTSLPTQTVYTILSLSGTCNERNGTFPPDCDLKNYYYCYYCHYYYFVTVVTNKKWELF